MIIFHCQKDMWIQSETVKAYTKQIRCKKEYYSYFTSRLLQLIDEAVWLGSGLFVFIGSAAFSL